MTNSIILGVFVTNFFGALLICVIFASNFWLIKERSTVSKNLISMGVVILASCLVTPIVYLIDGKSGLGYRILSFMLNSWVIVSAGLTSVQWMFFFKEHSAGDFGKKFLQKIFAILGMLVVMLVVNLFTPILFSIDKDNHYHRGLGVVIFLAVCTCCLILGMIEFIVIRRYSARLEFFHVSIYIVPLVGAITLQVYNPNISLIWLMAAIAFVGMICSVQSEKIYTDTLTGLYNRKYLQDLQKKLVRKMHTKYTYLLFDVNGFKQINDSFGHLVGDEALRAVSKILERELSENGNVIRFAGDEFIAVLNNADETRISFFIEKVKDAIEKYNYLNDKPYKLSISAGGLVYDCSTCTLEEIVEAIDELMYEDKEKYYNEKRHKQQSKMVNFDNSPKAGTEKNAIY